MSITDTFSSSNTFSESRARHVLEKVYADFQNLNNRRFSSLSQQRIQGWYDAVSFVMLEKALKSVELQFYPPGKTPSALLYTVIADGSIQTDDDSGRNDFWGFPDNTVVSIVISRDPKNITVTEYFKKRGWIKGDFLDEEGSYHGQYSKNGFGVDIKKKGSW